MSEAPRATVVIACRDERRFIGRCLDSILATAFPPDRLEVLIVDGMSTDGTRAVLADYARRHAIVRVLDNPQRSTPAGLNRGIRAARGAVVLRMDAHAVYPRDYIDRCLDALAESGADCVGGVWVTEVREAGWFAAGVRLTLTHPVGVGNSTFRLGTRQPRWVDAVPFGCFRREVFARAGLYNEALERSQDLDLWSRIRRAGGRIRLDPRIRSTYLARSRFGEVCRYNFGNGFWVTWPMRLVGTRFSARHLTPLAFVGVLLALTVGGLARPVLWRAEALAAGAYFAAIFAVSGLEAVRRRDARLAVTGPLAFAALHLAYGAGSLWGLVRPMSDAERRRARAATSAAGTLVEPPARRGAEA